MDTTSRQVLGEIKAAADQLTRDGERLQQLAKQLEESRRRIAEVDEDAASYRRAVYAWAIAQFEREPQLPDKDLEVLIAEEKGLPLEAFLEELKNSNND